MSYQEHYDPGSPMLHGSEPEGSDAPDCPRCGTQMEGRNYYSMKLHRHAGGWYCPECWDYLGEIEAATCKS